MRSWYRKLIELRKRMRANGLIDQANLTVDANVEDGLFLLRYEDAINGKLTVATRLTCPELNNMTAIDLSLPGDAILNSCDIEPAEQAEQALDKLTQYQLSPNQSLIFHESA